MPVSALSLACLTGKRDVVELLISALAQLDGPDGSLGRKRNGRDRPQVRDIPPLKGFKMIQEWIKLWIKMDQVM